MSRSLNRVTLIGNVGSDPEIRTTSNGGKVAQFSLATSQQWNDGRGEKKEKTEWHRCVVWNTSRNTPADLVERYVKKGGKLYVEGEIEYRQWQDKDGQTKYITEIKVREFMLLGGRNDGADDGAAAAPPSASRSASKSAPNPDGRPAALLDEDDDLPF